MDGLKVQRGGEGNASEVVFLGTLSYIPNSSGQYTSVADLVSAKGISPVKGDVIVVSPGAYGAQNSCCLGETYFNGSIWTGQSGSEMFYADEPVVAGSPTFGSKPVRVYYIAYKPV